MIRPVRLLCLLFVCIGCMNSLFAAETYPVLQGEPVVGDPMPLTADPRGLIFKKADGTLTERVTWTNFTQSALKQLGASSPKVKRFVDPLIEPEIEETQTKEREIKEIKPKDVPKMARPDPKAGFGSLFSSPIFVLVAILLYAANIYAAFEISIFRNYPAALVCGLAAVVPFIGPAIFMCIPTKMNVVEQPGHDLPVEEYAHAIPLGQDAGAVEEVAPVQDVSSGPLLPQAILYQRGQFVFNRRFFETKLAGFLRVVPGEAEKDMVVFIKSARGEYVAPHLTRITPNEVVMQIRKGDATTDVPIPFQEINEVQIRHKDA
jgi:hypothetical protein